MEVIVDADKRDDVITTDPAPNLQEFSDCLFGRNDPVVHLTLIYGGRLKEEYYQSTKAKRLIKRLDQSGRAEKINDQKVNNLADRINHICRSNDSHIIALGKLSNARTLCTEDDALEDDFTDPELLSPPGRVYKYQDDHRHLLTEDD